MFDYQTSKHAHFDAACRAFAIEHNLENVAAAVGMRPQILRNKLNPAQPHRLTCDELLAITDYTEDARLLDGMLGQINRAGQYVCGHSQREHVAFAGLGGERHGKPGQSDACLFSGAAAGTNGRE